MMLTHFIRIFPYCIRLRRIESIWIILIPQNVSLLIYFWGQRLKFYAWVIFLMTNITYNSIFSMQFIAIFELKMTVNKLVLSSEYISYIQRRYHKYEKDISISLILWSMLFFKNNSNLQIKILSISE